MSDIPDGLNRAYHTILFLGHRSFCPKALHVFRSTSRNLDDAADTLLVSLLKRLKLADRKFVPGPEFKELQRDVALLEADKARYRCYSPKSHGLMFSWVNGQGSALKLHNELKGEISQINAECEDKVQRMLHDKTPKFSLQNNESRLSATVAQLERDMAKFVPRIRFLGHMEDGLELAFKLVLFLGRQSYTDMGATPQYDPRYRVDFDKLADQLLLELACRIKEGNGAFTPEEEVQMLAGEIDHLVQLGIKSYFPLSFKLLASWVPSFAKAYAKESHDQLKAKIDKAHSAMAKRLAQYKYDKKRPTSDWLSSAMEEFIHEIADLSQKPESLILAIDLLVYLIEHSYTKLEDWQQILDPAKGLTADKYLDLEDITLVDTNFGPRPSDGPADKLLVKLISRAKRGKIETLLLKNYVNALSHSSKYLEKFGITTPFKASCLKLAALLSPEGR
jgi:hypothetical protein